MKYFNQERIFPLISLFFVHRLCDQAEGSRNVAHTRIIQVWIVFVKQTKSAQFLAFFILNLPLLKFFITNSCPRNKKVSQFSSLFSYCSFLVPPFCALKISFWKRFSGFRFKNRKCQCDLFVDFKILFLNWSKVRSQT